MNVSELFWNVSMEEIKNGFIEEQDCYICLLCGKQIEKGIIYPVDNVLYEARKYTVKHIENEHGSVFEYLNNLDKKYTGLSEHQSNLLGLFYEGKGDSEVQKQLNIGSASTIRNHRFVLKEKEKQAKVFLAMMELLKEKDKNVVPFVSPHKTAKMVDDRYKITEDENVKILRKYFSQGVRGKLKTFTMQEKHKIVVLREIVKRFDAGRIYTERELNEILKDIYEDDYVAIRRYLIEYGFMDRKKDCSEYWIKEISDNKDDSSKTIEKIISGIYQIRNIKNQKIFVASARNISKLNGQKFQLNMGSHHNKLLQSEWKQYGEDAFVFEVLESFEENEDLRSVNKELKRLEKEWILKLQPFGERGYNKE
jgi:hypothetical protein